jgi:hypothetical protein
LSIIDSKNGNIKQAIIPVVNNIFPYSNASENDIEIRANVGANGTMDFTYGTAQKFYITFSGKFNLTGKCGDTQNQDGS